MLKSDENKATSVGVRIDGFESLDGIPLLPGVLAENIDLLRRNTVIRPECHLP